MSRFAQILSILFLSTPSARRATVKDGYLFSNQYDFYPRPLRGGRRDNGDVAHHTVIISIHALCEEGDSPAFCGLGSALVFLSTPSARRATSGVNREQNLQD